MEIQKNFGDMNKECFGFLFFILVIKMAAQPEINAKGNKIRTIKSLVHSISGTTVIADSSIDANSISPQMYQVILIIIFLLQTLAFNVCEVCEPARVSNTLRDVVGHVLFVE